MAYDYNKYQNEYQNKKLAQLSIKLHKEHDADIIEYLDQLDNKSAAIKKIIRESINK